MPETLTTLDSAVREGGPVADALARARILYTDIDGTLLGRGGCLLCDLSGTPSLAGAQAVASINEAGFPVAIVSGRTVPMLAEISRMLGWRDFIAELGAIRSYDRGADVELSLGEWTAADVPEGSTAYEVVEDLGAIRALFDAFPGKLEYHTPHHRGRQATHLLRGHVDNDAAQTVLDAFAPPLTWLDNGIINPPKTTLDDVERVHAYHVMPRGITKAQAIRDDLAHRGLEPADAVMIGDGLADLAVRDTVGLVVLVENALRSPAVAAIAPTVDNLAFTAGQAGDGWAEFARHLLDAQSR